MKPNPVFLNQDHKFWAVVKYVSEQGGYTNRRTRANPTSTLKTFSPSQVRAVLQSKGLVHQNYARDLMHLVSAYISFRAEILETIVRPSLMDRTEASIRFEEVKRRVNPKLPIPMNRQKGDKRHEAYLAALVGMLAEEKLGHNGFIPDAQNLSILTSNDSLCGIFSRRFDGVVPTTTNPIAVWEIKEYYGTTTFGSRVADGVYETLLDGYEIKLYEEILNKRVAHYLFVDDRFTWWELGKSYLCRMLDMLHTQHVDEIFFGRQVITEWPSTLDSLRTSQSEL